MKKIIFFIVSILLVINLDAQIIFKGTIIDSSNSRPLTTVRVENLTTHQGDFSKSNGDFFIEGKEDDYIIFSYLGFKNKVIRLTQSLHNSTQIVKLAVKTVNLNDVIIKRGPTQYQRDSANRADIYKDAFDYSQTKSVMSPVTSIYQKFSKKHKNMRHFQEQIIDIEKQKFIDTRYTEELTSSLTKLKDEELRAFMNAYPMEIDYARAASDLEIKMWIKYNFQEYTKTKK